MADLAASLVSKYFPKSGNSLVIGDVSVVQLAEIYGTPIFIYDRAVLDQKFDALRSALPARFSIYYSIKANPCPAVVRHFLSRGCGIEIASVGEFRKALEAGCPAERILFAGPGKSEAELELVLSRGIGEIHMESLTEARRIAAICRRLGRRAQVAIRINPAGEAEGLDSRLGHRRPVDAEVGRVPRRRAVDVLVLRQEALPLRRIDRDLDAVDGVDLEEFRGLREVRQRAGRSMR